MPRKPPLEGEERPIVGEIAPAPMAIRQLVIKRRHLPEDVRKTISTLPKRKQQLARDVTASRKVSLAGLTGLRFIHYGNTPAHQQAVTYAARAISEHGLFGVSPLPKYAGKIAAALGKTHFIMGIDRKGNITIS